MSRTAKPARRRAFSDTEPTGTMALVAPQIRGAARRAADLIEQAELTLEEASDVIANGCLWLDPQEWIRPSRSGERPLATKTSHSPCSA